MIRNLIIIVGIGLLGSGCLLVAAGAVEMDRQNHKAPPPPTTESAPDAATAPPVTPAQPGTTSL